MSSKLSVSYLSVVRKFLTVIEKTISWQRKSVLLNLSGRVLELGWVFVILRQSKLNFAESNLFRLNLRKLTIQGKNWKDEEFVPWNGSTFQLNDFVLDSYDDRDNLN